MADLPIGASDFGGISVNGIRFLADLVSEINSLRLQLNQLITDTNNHVHGGITAGAANSAAMTTTAVSVSSLINTNSSVTGTENT